MNSFTAGNSSTSAAFKLESGAGLCERRQPIDVLAFHAQRLAARCENVDAGAVLEDQLGECRGRVDHVLAIIEHEQDP